MYLFWVKVDIHNSLQSLVDYLQNNWGLFQQMFCKYDFMKSLTIVNRWSNQNDYTFFGFLKTLQMLIQRFHFSHFRSETKLIITCWLLRQDKNLAVWHSDHELQFIAKQRQSSSFCLGVWTRCLMNELL